MAQFIKVKVQTRSKNPGVEKLNESEFRVRVTAAPEKGRANKEVIARLAADLGLPPSRLRIARGETSSTKLLEVEDAAPRARR